MKRLLFALSALFLISCSMSDYQLPATIPDDATVATFAGGCFWCMEGPFEAEEGVYESVAGYAGGTSENPTYEQVASGSTDFREGVQVYYDPSKVSYERLLEIYFRQIDPTDDGGQFADRGDHYRTAVFYHSPAEKEATEQHIQKLDAEGLYNGPIVTDVLPFTTFYPAEEKHQDFYKKSAEYYQRYKVGSGRDPFLERIWAPKE